MISLVLHISCGQPHVVATEHSMNETHWAHHNNPSQLYILFIIECCNESIYTNLLSLVSQCYTRNPLHNFAFIEYCKETLHTICTMTGSKREIDIATIGIPPTMLLSSFWCPDPSKSMGP